MISTWLFYLLLLLFPFGQLTRLVINQPEINIYAHDVVLVLLISVFIIKKIFRKEKLYLPKAGKPIFVFIICSLLSLFLNLGNWPLKVLVIGSLYLLRWAIYAVLYFFVYDLAKRNEKIRINIVQLLMVICLAAAVFGLLQYIFIPDIRHLTFLGWDPHFFRVVGTFLDPGFTGLIYVLGIILLVAKFSLGGFSIIHYSLFIIHYLALALTYSRSAYLAYLLAMGMIAWYKKTARLFLAVLVGGILTILLLPRPGGEGVKLERRSTVLSRIESYKKGLIIAFDNPVFGVGFNTLRYAQKKYGFLENDWQKSHSGAGNDSSLLFVFATTGIVGLCAYIYLLYKLLTSTLALKKSNKLKLVALTSLIAVFVHSFFNNSLFYPWIMIWLWIVLGLSEVG